MIEILTITVTPFQQNCRIVFDRANARSIVVDPGGDVERILSALDRHSLAPEAILLTHAHLDHAGGVVDLIEALAARRGEKPKLYGHRADAPFRAHLSEQAVFYGLSGDDYKNCPEPDIYLEGEEQLEFAGARVTVLFTPGHAPGHLSFFLDVESFTLDRNTINAPVVIAGDALFQGSVGRTDLPMGSSSQLLESIKTKLLTLPSDTVVLAGHGPETTIGAERRSNPFLNGFQVMD